MRPSIGEKIRLDFAFLCVHCARLTSPSRHCHADVRVDEGLAARGDDGGLGCVDVIAGCEGAAAGGQTCLFRELLDEERRGLVHCGDGDGAAVHVRHRAAVRSGSVCLDAFCWRRVGWRLDCVVLFCVHVTRGSNLGDAECTAREGSKCRCRNNSKHGRSFS